MMWRPLLVIVNLHGGRIQRWVGATPPPIWSPNIWFWHVTFFLEDPLIFGSQTTHTPTFCKSWIHHCTCLKPRLGLCTHSITIAIHSMLKFLHRVTMGQIPKSVNNWPFDPIFELNRAVALMNHSAQFLSDKSNTVPATRVYSQILTHDLRT